MAANERSSKRNASENLDATRGRTRKAGESWGSSVGKNVRRERERAGLSVRELGRRVGVSASFLSQFELGQSQAAVATLFAIASELNLSLDELLGNVVDAQRADSVDGTDSDGVSNAEHRPLDEYLAFQTGVRWKRLTEPGASKVDFLLTEYEPGSDSAPNGAPQKHRGNDYGYVLDGILTIDIDGVRSEVHANESIYMRGDVPHRLRNETDRVARAIWFVTG